MRDEALVYVPRPITASYVCGLAISHGRYVYAGMVPRQGTCRLGGPENVESLATEKAVLAAEINVAEVRNKESP